MEQRKRPTTARPLQYPDRQGADTLRGMYAINNAVGWHVLDKQNCDEGAQRAAATLQQPLTEHATTSPMDGRLGGDFSIEALNRALTISRSFRVDFTLAQSLGQSLLQWRTRVALRQLADSPAASGS